MLLSALLYSNEDCKLGCCPLRAEYASKSCKTGGHTHLQHVQGLAIDQHKVVGG